VRFVLPGMGSRSVAGAGAKCWPGMLPENGFFLSWTFRCQATFLPQQVMAIPATAGAGDISATADPYSGHSMCSE